MSKWLVFEATQTPVPFSNSSKGSIDKKTKEWIEEIAKIDAIGLMKIKKKEMISPGLEPGTTSVLDWCDNQLHHETVGVSSVNIAS